MLASKTFVDKICPVCDAQRRFYTVDDAYDHIICHPICWPDFRNMEEEKFNEELKEREAQQLEPEIDEGLEDPEEWKRYYSRNCKLLRRR